MKDILITVISILLTVVIIICMVKGLTVGSFRILSISNIKQESLNLDNEVDELNNLKNVTYKKKIDDLQTATKYLTTAKQKYLDLASVSSDEEIQEANLEQTYAMEFLWNKVGSYATKEGVTLKWDVSSTGVNNKYTLNFTTTGSYVGVISYIYALENDSDLAFRIENFKMTASGENVTATFTVIIQMNKQIRILQYSKEGVKNEVNSKRNIYNIAFMHSSMFSFWSYFLRLYTKQQSCSKYSRSI